jgi:hypothetical protein
VVRRPTDQHRHHYRPRRPGCFGGGNTFLNAGTVSGSVHLGDSTGGNTFTAVSGSSVNTAGIGVAGQVGGLR